MTILKKLTRFDKKACVDVGEPLFLRRESAVAERRNAAPGALTWTSVEVCPLCGESVSSSRLFATVHGLDYRSCARCSMVFLNPRPTQQALAAYYNDSYVYDRNVYQESVERQKSWLLGLFERFCKPPGRLLEVGCSYGYFLGAARERGWKTEGIEISGKAASFAAQTLGIPVIEQTLSNAREHISSSFDVVVAWHVIEHLTDPREFVEGIRGLLRPGGIVAIRTPNLTSVVAKLAGPRWEWLSPPDHLHMFSPRTLSALLRTCGYQVLLMQTARGNASNMWYEILRARMSSLLIRDQPIDFTNKNGPRLRRFASRLWYRAGKKAIEIGTRPVDLVLSPWLGKLKQEAELVVVAQNGSFGHGV